MKKVKRKALMNYYHSLNEFNQLKIEEKALEVLTKEKQPIIIYNGMIKPYLKRILSSNKGVFESI